MYILVDSSNHRTVVPVAQHAVHAAHRVIHFDGLGGGGTSGEVIVTCL